ncbi:MAG: hypothetical protein IPP07_27980 [Holophagales bacterium]|nr:hypothetical protein [Holophagales bacterium]MBK9968493.1 hypothetical protein [Holophagales bacterium]
MSRFTSRFFVAAAAFLLLAGSAAIQAQPSPTPTPGPAAGPGPWSAAHPLWFDLNGDGTPQPNELTGSPTLQTVGCTVVTGYPTVIGSSQSPCANVYEDAGIGGSVMRPNGVMQTLESNADGTQFTFNEVPYSPPAKAHGVAPLATMTATGTGQLLDQNNDGIYDALRVQGSNSSGAVPQTMISLVPKDATGDGRPDYITVPWTTSGAGMLGVATDATPQIYVPLTDTNGDGWADTITVQVANGGVTTATGPPLSGAALADGAAIPSASSFGLFVFAAAVVALGVTLLRGTIAAS